MESDAGSVWEALKPLLLRVERPSRYIGGEWNSPRIRERDVRVALAYPDVYEIGVSNLGIAILQEVVNDLDCASCERVYSPWVDMDNEMREAGIPLFSLETHRPVRDFDIFGISLPHELTYTNVINLLDLAGVPLRSADRSAGPLVVGGGCAVANPEPLAEFFDLFVLGEGEEAIREVVMLVKEARSKGWQREDVLRAAAGLPGVYVPSLYEVRYLEDGRVGSVSARGDAPERVLKRVVDIDRWLYPRKPVVPFCEAVHDRLNVEVFRGCTRGCRFCQAGMICRPVRERSPESVAGMVAELYGETGYDEVSLCSLSSADYTMIEELVEELAAFCKPRRMVVALPSLRMDAFSVQLASGLECAVRGGLTFAPEAGTERLRSVINKPQSEAEMAEALLSASRAGRRKIKLYFMIGLPTETDDDVRGISGLVYRLRDAVRAAGLPAPSFNVSVSTFVPKPHTPFQWAPQETFEGIERKQELLRSTLKGRGIRLSWHDAGMSTVEGLLGRGDRRLSRVVLGAWRRGARFDSWSDHFDFSRWEAALSEAGLDASFCLHRERGEGEAFPWDHIDYGLDRRFLYEEYRRAVKGETLSDCRSGACSGCGVCERTAVGPLLKGAWK